LAQPGYSNSHLSSSEAVVTLHSNPGMMDVCFQYISGLYLQNDCIESPELCIQTPDKVPAEVRPGFNCNNDLIPFPSNRLIPAFEYKRPRKFRGLSAVKQPVRTYSGI
jgi:hypothetical protein